MHHHDLNTDHYTDNHYHLMISMILWVAGIICFIVSGPKRVLLEVHDPELTELFRVWTTWALGSASSLVMLIINYPKIRDVVNKFLDKYKKKK